MYYQVEQVLEKQEPKVENYYKGRGILICESGQGLFALKEYYGSAEKAEFLYRLGAYLENEGIPCDSMLRNKEGSPVTEGVDGIRYTMHRWVRGRECDVKSRMDILMAVSFLAKFHRVCGREACMSILCPPQPEQAASPGLCEEYIRHDRELRKIRRFILKRHDKSDFERLYLSCCADFCRQSERVIRFLKEHPESGSDYTAGVCHGDFNQHNVLFVSPDPALIHLEHARIGAQISDLGNFMRKILEKYNWEERLGMDILNEYRRVHELRDVDLRGLYYRLAYPEKFWKIANHYYNSRKVWDSGRNQEKLSREIRQDLSRNRFLERFAKLL